MLIVHSQNGLEYRGCSTRYDENGSLSSNVFGCLYIGQLIVETFINVTHLLLLLVLVEYNTVVNNS